MSYLNKKYAKRLLNRLKYQLSKLPSDEDLSIHGAYAQGWLRGRISMLEDILDELEESQEIDCQEPQIPL